MSETKIPYKIYLDESEIPDSWYNVRADMKTGAAAESRHRRSADRRRNERHFL